ncbi:hypothetical protein CsatB_021770 [Cannabis sativa]
MAMVDEIGGGRDGVVVLRDRDNGQWRKEEYLGLWHSKKKIWDDSNISKKMEITYSLLVLSLLTTLMSSTQGFPWPYYNGNNNMIVCMNQYMNFKPCIGELIGFTYRNKPISSSCCAKVEDITSDANLCSHTLPYYHSLLSHSAFSQAQLHCTVPPPPPQSTPPVTYSWTFSYCGKNCGEEARLRKYYPNIKSFFNNKRPLSQDCCDTIIDVTNKCQCSPFLTQNTLPYCTSLLKKSPTTNIPPSPTQSTPPVYSWTFSYCGKNCEEEARLRKYYPDIKYFFNNKRPLSQDCCDTIIDVSNKCQCSPFLTQNTLPYCTSLPKKSPTTISN